MIIIKNNNRIIIKRLPFLVHLWFRGEDVTPLRGIWWLQFERVLPAAGSGCAAVHSEPVEAGDTERLLGIRVVVEIQSSVFQHAIPPRPTGWRGCFPCVFLLLAQISEAVWSVNRARRHLTHPQRRFQPGVDLVKRNDENRIRFEIEISKGEEIYLDKKSYSFDDIFRGARKICKWRFAFCFKLEKQF